MGSTKDFLTATLADAITPSFKRPVEDIIYETLDRRQTPSRTDFKELRDSLNSLNAQFSGFGNGVKKLKEGLDDLEESVHNLETQLIDLENLHRDQVAENSKLKDTVNILMEKVLLLEAGQSSKASTETMRVKSPQSSKIGTACKVQDCNEPTRASGFCGPHYGRWRRGTLDGFVGYDGNVIHGEHTVAVNKKLRGKAFSVTDNQILVEGTVVATLNG